MRTDEYLRFDLMGLADLVARREVSCSEVIDAAVNRLLEVNPKINAVTLQLIDHARTVAASDLHGPLAGVPYLIKDLTTSLAGTATTFGSKVFQHQVATTDSALVKALRAAGVVIIGKTNTPELGLEPVTEPALFGPTRNPWDLERTPGGSSGGAAAAVASGIVPAAHATDGGGSIRTPASCTGLFGLKPSRGRVSFAPNNEGWGGFSTQHAITRSVRDSALLLDIVSVPQPGDPYWHDQRSAFLDQVTRTPDRLRIAFSVEGLSGTSINPECAGAVLRVARICESLGHDVSEVKMPGGYAEVSASSSLVIMANVAATLENEAKRRGSAIPDDEIEFPAQLSYRLGAATSATDYIRALQICHAFGRTMAKFLEPYDVLLNSPLGSPPLKIGELRGDGRDVTAYRERLFGFMTNTSAANITGQPAMSVPLAWSESGLPIGIQFTARNGDEATLFRLAGQLEHAAPWSQRRPPGFG
jgi:Asp-tRNA(Asn)/Glu-tRNA(Gln) amidotransferase A subunit family amidase